MGRNDPTAEHDGQKKHYSRQEEATEECNFSELVWATGPRFKVETFFYDEAGVNLAMVRLYARCSLRGQRARGARPQTRQKCLDIGAIGQRR